MPSSALVELLHRVEAAICEYSEELVSQLARRDELEFEKEVKNTFITTLMEVQNRQKEQRDSSKRRRRDKALSLQGTGTVASVNAGNTGTPGMPVKVRGVTLNTVHIFLDLCSTFISFTQTFYQPDLISVDQALLHMSTSNGGD